MKNELTNGVDMRLGDRYEEFEQSITNNFNTLVDKDTYLFTTDAENLWETYLNNLPEEGRQHYNCNCCRHFIQRYGNLVVVTEEGTLESVLWSKEVPSFFKESAKELRKVVNKARITGVFISYIRTLGTSQTGIWSHLHVTLPKEKVNNSRLLNANQVMSEKLEDYRMINRALQEYSLENVNQALTLLQSESLYRSDKCLGVAKWFKGLHDDRLNSNNSRIKENITWVYVASAPTGFCHIKSSMIGTLLDDIASGMKFDSVSKRFSEKMNPLQYQRPQAAPTVGNIAQAEKIVEKLGIQKSLVRRFARVEELEKIWTPKEKKEQVKNEGVFSHLVAKGKKESTQMDMPPITMTWRKFSETVLPFAENIEFLVKSGRDNYSAILTTSHEDAPPILQWDSEEKRNPFSWYVYSGGSDYSKWNLSTGYCKVTGVSYQPSMWYGDFPHQSKSVYFILEGAKDSGYKGAGNALFPETLKSELREIRSSIEAYSKSATIEGYEEASACGIRLQYGSNWDATFRVKTNTGTAVYKLDRWD